MEPTAGHMETGQHMERSAKVYAFVCSFMKASQGCSPTAREIQRGTGLRSLRHVHVSLSELERAGRIKRGKFGRPRSLRIVGARYLLPDEAEAGGRDR